MNVRRRKRDEGLLPTSDLYDDDVRGHVNSGVQPLWYYQTRRFYTLGVLLLSLYGIVQLSDLLMPTPLMTSDEPQNPGKFIAERAKLHVTHLSNLGPRPVGSLANEVLAIKYLTKTLGSIQAQSHPSKVVEVDQQVVSGEFPLQFLDGLNSVYRNIQNVVVRLRGKAPSASALLLNCHYDSVVDSPGATDDLAACAVLLEVLRVISQSNTTLRHDLVFLFNGAEENILQASHGFITQHKWAKNLFAVVNMDACGAGGREILFQVGPDNPWLLEAYANAVKYPTASIAAQEIFQSGLIPGDTDYRIFRDFGRIPGFDFAWAMGGYMYHTKLDAADYVPLSSLQHAGENILPLTLHLANSNCPKDCEPQGATVFFDILHLYLFRIPSGVASAISYLCVAFSFVIIHWNAGSTSPTSTNRRRHNLHYVVRVSVYLLASWLATIIFNALLAVGIYSMNRSLSWFSRPLWIYFLYGVPAVALPLQFALLAQTHLKKALNTRSSWVIVNLYVDANQLLWTMGIIIGSLANVKSIFLLTVYCGYYCLSNLGKNFAFNGRMRGRWLYFYVAPSLFPCLMLWYISHVLFKTVIPIMGRAGAGMGPEIVISVLTSAVIIVVSSIAVPVVFMFANNQKIVKALVMVFLSSLMVLIFTPLSFPYSDSLHSPSPQRYTILHSHRVYHGVNNVKLSDISGFWIVDLDPNSPYSVKSFIPEFADAVPIDDCSKLLYCGLPYKLPISKLLSKTHWMTGPKPNVLIPSNLTLMDTVYKDETMLIMNIKAEGPDHMTIMLSPIDGVEMTSWSFANGTFLHGPKWGKRDTFFVYYSYASYPGPLTFWVQLKIVDPSVSRSPFFLDMAVSGHFLHGPHQKSVPLTKLLAQFPPWTVTSGWVATYTSYKF